MAGEKKGALSMTGVDDPIGAGAQVVDVHGRDVVRSRTLRPRGDSVANVGLPPGALPEVAARTSGRRPDLPELARLRVPRPGREVVEAVEAVVLVPDKPATVECAVRLIVVGIGERSDPRHRRARCADPRDTRERGRVDGAEERAAVVRECPRNEPGRAGQRHHVAREYAMPRRARAGFAPVRRRSGRGSTRRDERCRQRKHDSYAAKSTTRRSHARRRSRRSGYWAESSTPARLPTN